MSKAEDKKYYELWQQYRENTSRATPIDLNETPAEKKKRIDDLEANPEKWFKYYFPNYYTSDPAPFHIKATKRVLENPEWYEVRSWSRELAKSARTMMEILYLTVTGKKKTVLMVSATKDDAERLLLPYKVNLETNHRLINDYGTQQSLGKWESGDFKTKKGVSFRAIGAGQSPRGTRNEASRPDVILIDDIDTDEECRNKERIKNKYEWISSALYACRSISESLLWIANGNIIAKYCCITEMAKVADKHEIINIRDKDGKSTWPSKNTEEFIDRTLSKQPWSAQQKEYYNNPVKKGDVFKEITFGKCPPLKYCDQVEIYADPSTSNKDRGANKQASYKSVGVIGRKGRKFYIYKVWLLQTSNSKFITWMYEAYLYCKDKGVDTLRVSIENNSLQAPHYEQVLLPLIYQMADTYGFTLPVTEDKRNKPDKFFRIEGTLEPLNRLGNLIFNIAEKQDPHMVRMEDQMLGVSSTASVMDGPDMAEGGVWKLQNRQMRKQTTYAYGQRESRHY
ncbi:hypothetical protein [Formosa sp. A9]|uniref:hypothetical protein n=1 Tax=Formosa sp. A9 TaxID=3442641 RepID=UPI003EC05A56